MKNSESDLELKLQNIKPISAPKLLKWKIFAKLCGKIFDKELQQSFLYINYIIKMKTRVILPALGILVGGFVLLNANGSSYQDHLANADESIAELRVLAQGGELVQKDSFELIPTAHAGGSTTEIEELVRELVQKIIAETEAAIEEVEELDNAAETAEALVAVDSIQDETVEVLDEVIENVEIEDVTVMEEVTEAIEETAEVNEKIEVALEETEVAIEAGAEEVEVEITTSEDIEDVESTDEEDEPTKTEVRAEAAKAVYEEAQALLATFEDEGLEVNNKLQSKIDKIEAAIEACEAEGAKCKAGRIKGLSTALKAKARNELRKAAKKARKGEEVVEEEVTTEEESTDRRVCY